MAVNVSLKDLIEAGAHFGHQTRRWNPKMGEYLYGSKEGIHIFDLAKTKEKLEEALNVLRNASKEGKTIIFVGTKKQAREKVKELAKKTGVFYVNERWLGGMLTNFEQVKKSSQKLTEMKGKMDRGEYSEYTKKERLTFEREIERLERFFAGVVGMAKKPDLLVVIDVKKEIGAVKEARATGVTTMGIVDSNSDPTVVDYPVPMNDDANLAIGYVLDIMGDALLEGKGGKGGASDVGKKSDGDGKQPSSASKKATKKTEKAKKKTE